MSQHYGRKGGEGSWRPFMVTQEQAGIDIYDLVKDKGIVIPEPVFKEMVEDWAEYFRTQPARTEADWDEVDRDRMGADKPKDQP